MFDHDIDLDRRFASLRSGLIVPTDIADSAIQTRHLAAGVYGSPVAAADALADGAAVTVARSDHVHRVPGIKTPAAAFPGSPVEGDLFYETDTDKLWAYDGTNWVQLVDTGAWDSWTTTLTGISLGNGVAIPRYTRTGRTIIGRLEIDFGSTTSLAATDCFFTFPVAASTTYEAQHPIGVADFADTGTADFFGAVWWNSTTTGRIVTFATTGSWTQAAVLTSTVPLPWTTNDRIKCSFTYEANVST